MSRVRREVGVIRTDGINTVTWSVQALVQQIREGAGEQAAVSTRSGAPCVASTWFKIGMFDFRLLAGRQRTRGAPAFISVYLDAKPSGGGAWPRGSFTLQLVNKRTSKEYVQWTSHKYSHVEDDWGFPKFCEAGGFHAGDDADVTVVFDPVTLGTDSQLLLSVLSCAGLVQFYGSDELSDCTVVAEDGGRTFFTHKLALSAASPVFKAVFTTSSSMSEAASSCLVIREAAADVVELLLQLAYGCNVALPLLRALDVCKLADQYQAMALKEAIEQTMSDKRICYTADALAQLVPQALRLGDVAARISAHLLAQAGQRMKQLRQQPAFLQHWTVADVVAVLEKLPDAPKHLGALLLAAAWVSADKENRLPHYQPRLQPLLPLQHVTATQVRWLQQRQPEVLQLPGLAVQLVQQWASSAEAGADAAMDPSDDVSDDDTP